MTKHILTAAVLAALWSLPSAAMQETPSGKQAGKKTSKTAQASTPPSDQDIANAKSQGLVWADPDSRVYYKSGDLYGKTKRGKFATEDDSKKQGIFEAPQTTSSKKGSKKRPDQSGIDDTIETHSSTAAKQ